MDSTRTSAAVPSPRGSTAAQRSCSSRAGMPASLGKTLPLVVGARQHHYMMCPLSRCAQSAPFLWRAAVRPVDAGRAPRSQLPAPRPGGRPPMCGTMLPRGCDTNSAPLPTGLHDRSGRAYPHPGDRPAKLILARGSRRACRASPRSAAGTAPPSRRPPPAPQCRDADVPGPSRTEKRQHLIRNS